MPGKSPARGPQVRKVYSRAFRKRHPEITQNYTRLKFPVIAYNFPVLSQKIPVRMSSEFGWTLLNQLAD
jgi:hypothetical protein